MRQGILGIDIGGTKCSVVLGQISQEGMMIVLNKIMFPTALGKDYSHTLQDICNAIDRQLEIAGIQGISIDAIGIICGGPLDSRKGTIQSPPNLPGWNNVPIVDYLRERYAIPNIYLQNDADACALAEWKFGAGKGFRDVIFLTFGTGMGAGLILNGALYSGATNLAGEIGHIRMSEIGPVGYGKMGSFEGFCSGSGIAQLARIKALEQIQRGSKVSYCETLDNLDQVDAKSVAEAAFRGDLTAIEVYRQVGVYLGKGISILIDILNPEIIIIGSIYVRAKMLIEPYMLSCIKKEALSDCQIVPAKLHESIGDIAALSVAVN